MTLSREFYNYYDSIAQLNPITGKMDLNHIEVGDERLIELRKLAIAQNKRNKKHNDYPTVARKLLIQKAKEDYFPADSVDWTLIRYVRSKRAISQPEMANRIGLSVSWYKALENRHKDVKRSFLYAICMELEIEVIETKDPVKIKVEKKKNSVIKRKRLKLGLTQSEAALMAGVAQSTFNRIEKGIAPSDSAVAIKVRETFGIGE